MKLRNKKTGEIKDLLWVINHLENDKDTFTLAELNEEWEDYKEPKEYWYVDEDGEVWHHEVSKCEDRAARKSIGNYFETREEAEKAVEKLKAWNRLKDKGFRFTQWRHDVMNQKYIITMEEKDFEEWAVGRKKEDLDLLFGGKK